LIIKTEKKIFLPELQPYIITDFGFYLVAVVVVIVVIIIIFS